MKNIHLLPTDKPSQLFHYIERPDKFFLDLKRERIPVSTVIHKNIYITNDEEIKDVCWVLDIRTNEKFKAGTGYNNQNHIKKIILTDNEDLIKDGVQSIDDAFLEWFVKNPSCEFVETLIINEYDVLVKDKKEKYKIIIPKEEPSKTHYLDELPNMDRDVLSKMWEAAMPKLEPKQETLDNARREYVSDINCGFYSEQIVDTIKAFSSDAFEQGYKFAQEQNKELFSKEEVLEQLNLLYSMKNSLVDTFTDKNDYITMKWFEQFK